MASRRPVDHAGRGRAAVPRLRRARAAADVGWRHRCGRARAGSAPPTRRCSSSRAAQEPTARALVDRLLAQDDGPGVPVIEMIDERLALGRGDGYRYEDMPEDREAWRALGRGARRRRPATLGATVRRPDPRRADRSCIEEVRTLRATGTGCPPAGLRAVDAVRVHGVLLPPMGVERDRLRRPRVPAGLQEPRDRPARAVGGRGARRAGPGPVGRAGGAARAGHPIGPPTPSDTTSLDRAEPSAQGRAG